MFADIKIVGKGNAMSTLYLEDFVFAVTVECGPFYGGRVCVAPIKEGGVTIVAHPKLAT